MGKEYASLRRRPFLAPVWILSLAAVAAVAAAGWAVHVATTTVVIVMRHAEKAPDGTADPPLSEAGIQRAARLAAMFGGAPSGLGIDGVFVTQFRRTLDTVRPLAIQRALPVATVPADDLEQLVRRIGREFQGRRVLVVAHSDTVPSIVARLGERTDVPPIGDDEWGTAYVIAMPRWGRPTVLRLSLP